LIDEDDLDIKIDEFLDSNKYIENNIRKYNFINNSIEVYKYKEKIKKKKKII